MLSVCPDRFVKCEQFYYALDAILSSRSTYNCRGPFNIVFWLPSLWAETISCISWASCTRDLFLSVSSRYFWDENSKYYLSTRLNYSWTLPLHKVGIIHFVLCQLLYIVKSLYFYYKSTRKKLKLHVQGETQTHRHGIYRNPELIKLSYCLSLKSTVFESCVIRAPTTYRTPALLPLSISASNHCSSQKFARICLSSLQGTGDKCWALSWLA